MTVLSRSGSETPRRWAALALAIVCCFAIGCGDDSTGPQVAPEAIEAAKAANTAAAMQQIASTESMLDDVENPLTSAAGNFETFGAVSDLEGIDDYSGVSSQVVATLSTYRDNLPMERQLPGVRAMVAKHYAAAKRACESVNTEGGVRETCIDDLTNNVVRVTVTETYDVGLVESIASTFEVDTVGTATAEDDIMRSFETVTRLRTGRVTTVQVAPTQGDEIIDNAVVALTETIDFVVGLIDRQTNQLTMDVGMLDVENDEVIWMLASTQNWINGAITAISAAEETEGEADGIRDNDSVRVTATFTAAPTNDRLQQVVSTIVANLVLLDNEEDDLFASVSRTVTFDGQTDAGGTPTATESYMPAEPVLQGEEPCSGTFSRTANFPAGWEAQSLQQTVTHDCNAGGTASMDVTFSDGTDFERDITWDGAGVATLDEMRRDGTVVAGTFDENDNSFDVTTTFPAGSDPTQVAQSGMSNDDTGERSYTIEATYADQTTRTLTVATNENSDGTSTVSGSEVTEDGTSTFTMTWNPATATLSGAASGPNDETLDYLLVWQEDGSGLWDFTYMDPNDDLTVVGDMVVNPDGSGCGTLRVERNNLATITPVCFDGNGNMWIDEDGTPIPL